MAKEENLDDLLAQQKEHEEKQAELKRKIKASAVSEAASIREKVNNIESLSGISKFELLEITKDEAIKYYKIRQRTESSPTKKPLTPDDIKIKEYLEANPTRIFNREKGKTYTFKQKGPVPKEVRQMILEELAKE